MLLQDFLHRVYFPSRLGLSESTAYQLTLTVRILERWAGRPVEVEALTETMLRDFLADFAGDRAGATINTVRHRLLALWRQAWQEELLPSPPRTKLIPKARDSPAIPEAWTAAEVGRILTAANRLRGTIAGIPRAAWWLSILSTAYDTGERRGALLAVAPADVGLEAGRIIFRKTKTGRLRVCSLHPDTLAAIRVIYNPAAELLWPWPHSRPNLSARFRTILSNAGVAHGRGRGGLFHKLRRTSGTLVEVSGGDGSRHLGNTRRVFEQSYLDPRFLPDQLGLLPRPTL